MNLLKTIQKHLTELSIDELHQLNDDVVNTINFKHRAFCMQTKRLLSVGDEVRFTYKDKEHTGILIKKNRTKAIVESGGESWRIPFSMLTPA